jgi:hypothetical protein
LANGRANAIALPPQPPQPLQPQRQPPPEPPQRRYHFTRQLHRENGRATGCACAKW